MCKSPCAFVDETGFHRSSFVQGDPSRNRDLSIPVSSTTPWEVLDSVSVSDVFKRRFKTLQSCPVHLKGRFRQAAQLALEARLLAASNEDVTKETSGCCAVPRAKVVLAKQS